MKRIAVLTSGGDAPGMNPALRAVVRTAVAHGLEIFGIQRGYQGLIDGELSPMDARSVSGIIHHGGTILRTARCPDFKHAEGRARAADRLRRLEIEGLVVIGGDGSYRGAYELWRDHGTACVGIPGTIDNDIGGTEYTIGFDTALNTAVEAIDRLRDTAASHDRIFFVEVMGRHSGFIAMYSGLAGGAEGILVPETKTEISVLVAALREASARGKKSMIVIVAEGDDAGNAFDIARQVADSSEFKDVRVSVLGHLQRGGTPTAFDRVLAARMGVAAVEALLTGASNTMMVLENNAIARKPITEAWETRNLFDPDLFRMNSLLSV
ncbi:MAG TPA: 6-phosphofructokinase [Candidatus Hydrogenedentes bacterium]|jgi:6-phosphofructokinase 1|nr:6-phosphofructokinase [Candidatus Hydrogenedentota bacterium]HQN00194.1 6-phosphofructokinase [Candidatus Hydrogenedentota bacterium]